MTIEENELFSMSLHEERWCKDINLGIVKVIGGWIYYYSDPQTDEIKTMVFVPIPKREIEITGRTKLDF